MRSFTITAAVKSRQKGVGGRGTRLLLLACAKKEIHEVGEIHWLEVRRSRSV